MNKSKQQKYKILLIDDDKFLSDMYVLKFKEHNLNIESVSSGMEAIKKLRGSRDFNVIILDLVMPNMDGFEVLENIKKEKLAENSVIIVFSNQNQLLDIERANELSIDGYIIKANTIPSELLEQVIGIADSKFNKPN